MAGLKTKKRKSKHARRKKPYVSTLFLLVKFFAIAKVKLLHSDMLRTSEVKFAHNFAVRRNFTHEVNFTIEDNFTCPKGKLS